jgi:hypothetical protein
MGGSKTYFSGTVMTRKGNMERIASVAAVAVACAGIASTAYAQVGKLGTYTGVVSISGAEIGKHSKVDFRATVKVSLPVASSKDGSTRAEADDVDKPSAIATITQWELEARNGSPDSDGKITTWKCSLAAPTDVPMNASGALDVDHRTKKYSMFVALVSTKPIPLKCVNSRSGAYKKTESVSLFFGTSEPDLMPANALPYADLARLTAKHKLVPAGSMKGSYGPVDMEWDLRLGK